MNTAVKTFLKTIIQTHLELSIELLEKQVPKHKKSAKYISIDHVSPMDLPQFISENNIPKECCFTTDVNEDVSLYWEIDVPTTDQDKLIFKRKRFDSILWTYIYKTMIENGYKRKGVDSGLFKQFNDATIYDRYVNKDFDRIVDYYSLYFKEGK